MLLPTILCYHIPKSASRFFQQVDNLQQLQWLSGSHIEHDDVIKWKHFPRHWPFVQGIHRSPVSSPHKGQWRGALMFSLICSWMNVWVSNRDLRRHRTHHDVTVMNASIESCLLYAMWAEIYCLISPDDCYSPGPLPQNDRLSVHLDSKYNDKTAIKLSGRYCYMKPRPSYLYHG